MNVHKCSSEHGNIQTSTLSIPYPKRKTRTYPARRGSAFFKMREKMNYTTLGLIQGFGPLGNGARIGIFSALDPMADQRLVPASGTGDPAGITGLIDRFGKNR